MQTRFIFSQIRETVGLLAAQRKKKLGSTRDEKEIKRRVPWIGSIRDNESFAGMEALLV